MILNRDVTGPDLGFASDFFAENMLKGKKGQGGPAIKRLVQVRGVVAWTRERAVDVEMANRRQILDISKVYSTGFPTGLDGGVRG